MHCLWTAVNARVSQGAQVPSPVTFQSDFCEAINTLNVVCSPAADTPGDTDNMFACLVTFSFLPERSFVKAFVRNWESPSSSRMSSALWALPQAGQECFCRSSFEEE